MLPAQTGLAQLSPSDVGSASTKYQSGFWCVSRVKMNASYNEKARLRKVWRRASAYR